jgi:hypothetical protein
LNFRDLFKRYRIKKGICLNYMVRPYGRLGIILWSLGNDSPFGCTGSLLSSQKGNQLGPRDADMERWKTGKELENEKWTY